MLGLRPHQQVFFFLTDQLFVIVLNSVTYAWGIYLCTLPLSPGGTIKEIKRIKNARLDAGTLWRGTRVAASGVFDTWRAGMWGPLAALDRWPLITWYLYRNIRRGGSESGRLRQVAANYRWPLVQVLLYIYICMYVCMYIHCIYKYLHFKHTSLITVYNCAEVWSFIVLQWYFCSR